MRLKHQVIIFGGLASSCAVGAFIAPQPLSTLLAIGAVAATAVLAAGFIGALSV